MQREIALLCEGYSHNKERINMSEKKEKKIKKPRMYEGYDIRWLKEVGEDHPDFKLVSEYEKKYGEIK